MRSVLAVALALVGCAGETFVIYLDPPARDASVEDREAASAVFAEVREAASVEDHEVAPAVFRDPPARDPQAGGGEASDAASPLPSPDAAEDAVAPDAPSQPDVTYDEPRFRGCVAECSPTRAVVPHGENCCWGRKCNDGVCEIQGCYLNAYRPSDAGGYLISLYFVIGQSCIDATHPCKVTPELYREGCPVLTCSAEGCCADRWGACH